MAPLYDFFNKTVGFRRDDPTYMFDRAYYQSFYDKEGAVKQLRKIAILFTT